MSKYKLPLWILALIAMFFLGSYGIRQVIPTTNNNSQSQDSPVQTSIQDKSDQTEDSPSNSTLELLGQELPEFTVTNIEGHSFSSSNFYDKPMVIMEWASWCKYCQEQMPIMQKLYDNYKDKVNFVFINATGSNGETPQAAQAYMTQKGYTVPWFVDEGMVTAKLLKLETTPTTYIVDKDQTIQSVFPSIQTVESLTKAIEAVLN